MSDFDYLDDDQEAEGTDSDDVEAVSAQDPTSSRRRQLETRRRIEEALERRRFREEFGDYELDL